MHLIIYQVPVYWLPILTRQSVLRLYMDAHHYSNIISCGEMDKNSPVI